MLNNNPEVVAYKGDIIFTPQFGQFQTCKNGYIIVENGRIKGVYAAMPELYRHIRIVDYSNKLIIPGFIDLHFHAPQFVNRGLGMDRELLPWLETYAFPEEAKYSDLAYAEKAYKKVIKELWKQGTTRVVLFATIHKAASKMLVELLAQAGLGGCVGKVNMDRNSPEILIEETKQSLIDTEEFIQECLGKYERVQPILTPRFVPSCTPELMQGLGNLAKRYHLPVQSHLSENTGEIAWVKALHPEYDYYAAVYQAYGLFGQQPTIMAHCVYSSEQEMDLMVKNQVFVAHCPFSNNNVSSGIAPIRKFIQKGVPVGLGSDVSGGHEVSIAKVMSIAIQVSKIKWLYTNKSEECLTMAEVFYLGTKGGGNFFGKVGSFEAGYDFDALVIDDCNLADFNQRTIEERLERFIYIGDDRHIVDRYVAGNKIAEPSS